jgi:3-oxoacyl-[acyl-carrier-protein] synthase-3
MGSRIIDIAYHLPEVTETNATLTTLHPTWQIDQVEEKTGVTTRYLAAPGETAADLGYRAVQKLAAKYPDLFATIDGLLFCSVTEDHQFPRNSSLLHGRLNLPPNVFALDVGMACSGFVYCLAVAHGLIEAGFQKNILIVTADTYSHLVGPRDRATKLLFSDGAAATWVSAAADGCGLLDVACGTYGQGFQGAWIPAGRARTPATAATSCEVADASGNFRTPEQLHMDGKKMMAMAGSLVPKQVRQLLQNNNLTVADIDLFVFHQASKLVLDSLEKLLRLPPEKNFRNIMETGNLTSTSIPVALKDALDRGVIHGGEKVVISGFGAGFSFASAILAM